LADFAGIYFSCVGSGTLNQLGSSLEGPSVVVSDLYSPHAFCLDTSANKIYFNDFRNIKKCDPDGTNLETIISPDDIPETATYMNTRGVAVDTVNDKIWFGDSYYDRIIKCDLDGGNIEIMYSGYHSIGYGGIEDIVIDVDNECVYWSTAVGAGHPGDSDYSIHKMNYDGTGHTRVAVNATRRFAGLHLDIDSNTIYWSNLIGGSIEASGLITGNVETVLSSLNSPYFVSFDPTNDKLYWTSNSAGQLLCDDIGGGSQELLADDYDDIRCVRFFSRSDGDPVDSCAGSGSLYIRGVGTPSPGTTSLRSINRLTKTGDYDPELVCNFQTSPTTVSIRVWDVGDGQNSEVVITDNECYSIGDTGAWGWSTNNLPFTSERDKYHYYYEMIPDIGESQYGEFIIRVPEN